MKQRPTSDKLANELLGASAFFRPDLRTREAPPSPPEADTPQAAAPPAQPTTTPVTPVTHDVTTSRRQSVTTSNSPAPVEGFDINRETASRDSLRLSIDETKALDALRSTLKWDHDLTVSKNDICRVALHALLEEFATKGDKSTALARLKRKHAGR